ncbi:MAG TPA: beta-eliminating lyase-related protein [Thermomicrobiales bacterium]|jgi:threonine aldolase
MSAYGSAPVTTERDVDAIRRACTRAIAHHYRRSPHEVLTELAATIDPALQADIYGQGGPIAPFEAEIATLLGKEAAVFMPSGTMCQQIALRIWAERHGRRTVGMHPRNHLDTFEHHAYQVLHNLRGVPIGDPDRLLTSADLAKVAEPLGTLLIELPQREIGGQLPSWDELLAITTWARERDIALHLDGARLWESSPFYARPYAEIAALFDTVYVSFYKGLGGIAGAILAGPTDVIAEARIWQRRHGGNLIHLYPYVLSARDGLRKRLDLMPRYHEQAVAIATALTALSGLDLVPNPPHTHMFHLYLRGDRARLLDAALDIAAETGIWTFERLGATPLPNVHKLELTVGDATLDLTAEEIVGVFTAVLERAGASG